MIKSIKKWLILLLAGLATIVWLTGCADKETSLRSHIARTLSIDCANGVINQQYDSHGGFHGDGTCFYAIQFPDDTQALTIAQSDRWNPLPLTDELTAQVWGLEIGETYYAPSVIKNNDWEHPLIPAVTNGYYFFFDRHRDAITPSDDAQLLDDSRLSYNFTLALYDTDTNILYFAEVDT